MREENPLQEPGSERDDRPDELYGTREYPPGLQSPQRLSQAPAWLDRPRCATCAGRVELVDLVGRPYWRHLDLADFDRPHSAHVDFLRPPAAAAAAPSPGVAPAEAHGDIDELENEPSTLGAEEDSCAAQDHAEGDR